MCNLKEIHILKFSILVLNCETKEEKDIILSVKTTPTYSLNIVLYFTLV